MYLNTKGFLVSSSTSQREEKDLMLEERVV
jgi:hypothetical protein